MRQLASRSITARLFATWAFASAGFFLAVLIPGVLAANVPARTLRFGDTGEDVRSLQILLNASLDTQVAQSGAGSPGYESDYFGVKTFDAVKRFQTKYQAEILSPLGLVSATGIVGPATLKKLQSLITSAATNTVLEVTGQNESPKSIPTAAASSSAKPPVPLTQNMQIPADVNPNSVNLDYFIAEVDAVGKKQGTNPADLLAIESAIRQTAATTTDFRKKFFEEAKLKEKKTAAAPGLTAQLAQIFERTLAFFGFVQVAQAQSVDAPFGGALFYAYPCTCSGNWLIGIEPLPPTLPALLSYDSGTQLFASHNIPATTELLGFYLPGTQACYEVVPDGCAPIPNEGWITPFVGSSPL